jgi:hypothetical protein
MHTDRHAGKQAGKKQQHKTKEQKNKTPKPQKQKPTTKRHKKKQITKRKNACTYTRARIQTGGCADRQADKQTATKDKQ